jgi:hypothetical protein
VAIVKHVPNIPLCALAFEQRAAAAIPSRAVGVLLVLVRCSTAPTSVRIADYTLRVDLNTSNKAVSEEQVARAAKRRDAPLRF